MLDKKYIAPSFLAADIWRAAEQVEAVEQAGCRYLHLDIMDGHFVPNISFGADYVKMLRPRSKMIFDAHLMVTRPELYFDDFKAAGCDIVTVHVEACRHLQRNIAALRQLGLKAGVALNPSTPLVMLEEILAEVDLVLLMSVNPGFCGQQYLPSVREKLRRLRLIRDKKGLDFIIEVDGGINADNVADAASAGAELIVAGSAVFGDKDCAAAYKILSEKANS
ncbi:MAG: ribulose-phosphate 3-epimerase [Bacillota bacterium]|nr:ribulose-phosphate 3-epimerase [Bacillota bacterium]